MHLNLGRMGSPFLRERDRERERALLTMENKDLEEEIEKLKQELLQTKLAKV